MTLEEAVGVDVDLDPDPPRRGGLPEPAAHDWLDAHVARRLQEKPAPVSAAQQREGLRKCPLSET